MKKYLFLVVTMLGTIFPVFAQKNNTSSDRILVISSYSPLKEEGSHIISSFLNRINLRLPVKVSAEYMDSEAFPGFPHWVEWLESLFNAYGTPPSLVVLIGGEVWAAYRESCPAEWKNIPVVLGGVKGAFIDYKNWSANQLSTVEALPALLSTFEDFKVTGYYIKDYLEENIRLIRELQPEVTDIAFYYDDRYRHAFLNSYLRQITKYFKDIRLHCWIGSSMSTRDLIDSIGAYGPQLALLSAGWFTDVDHYSHAYSMLQNELLRYPDRSVYEMMDQNSTHPHYIGGYFVSGKEIGEDLADLVVELKNTGFKEIPPVRLTPSKPAYHLNYTKFRQMNFDKERLSADVVWDNVPPTVWDKYGESLIIALFITVFALLSIVMVLIYRWRREQYLIKSSRRMQQLLEIMPDMALVFGNDKKILDIVNPKPAFMSGLKSEELVGKEVSQIPEFDQVFRGVSAALNEVLLTRKALSFNYTVTYQGTEVYPEIRLFPLESGRVICFIHDMTSAVVTEKEVIKYKNFLQSVIDHLPLGVFVKDVSNDYRYIYCNQDVVEFYGNPKKDFLGCNDFELGYLLADEYRKEDERVLQSKEPVSFTREFTDEEGNKRWAVVTKVCLLNK